MSVIEYGTHPPPYRDRMRDDRRYEGESAE